MSRSGLSLCLAAAVGASGLVVPSPAPVEAHVEPAMPPMARPGECYGRVVTPPVYGSVKKKVLVKEAWTETRKGEPVVEKSTRRVLVKPERVEKVRTPAQYKTTVRWVTKPGVSRKVTKPARYEIVTKKVMVEPARAEWRLTSAPLAYGEYRGGQTMLEPTGEVWCRVIIPAHYEYVERKVKVAPARTYTVAGKPRKVKVVDRVLVKPAGWAEKKVPAVYRTEVVKTVVKAGAPKVVHHPAVYKTIAKPALVQAPGAGWAQVVCGGALHPAFMAQVQEALIASGYDPGPPDGMDNPQTYAALRMYQRDRGLAQGQLTVESARALGVL